jgi:hypothetical protein
MVLLNLIKSMFNTLFVPIYNLFEFFIISLTARLIKKIIIIFNYYYNKV